MAGALIGALRVSLSAETSAFEAGMKRSQRTAKATANSISSSFKTAGNAVGLLKAGVAGFVASLSAGTILAAVKASLDYAASLGETADQLGVTTRELQNFRAAAAENGASLEEADSALGKLTLNMSKAISGSKQATAAFNSVGVSISDMTTKSRWEIIGQIADQMNRQGGAAKNAAAGVAIFGRGFQKIIPTLNQGSAGLNDLADANEKLGGVLSDKEIQNADKTADKIDQLYRVLKTKLASDVAANSTAIGEFTTFLFGLVDAATKARQALADFTKNYNVFNLGTGKAFGFGYSGKSVTTKLGEGGTADAEARRRGLKLMSDVPRTPAGEPPQFLAGGGGGRSRRTREDHSAERALRDANQFDEQIRRAKIDVLNATRDLATDAVERYAISIQIKDAEDAAFEAELQYQQNLFALTKGQDGLSASQAEELKIQHDIVSDLERKKLIADEQERAAASSSRLDMLSLDLKEQDLRLQLELADTSKEARDISLRLLDIARQKEQAAIDELAASRDIADQEAARRRQLALNSSLGNERQAVINNTRGPMEQFHAQFSDISEEMEQIKVDGINAAASVLAAFNGDFGDLRDNAISALQQVASEILRVQLLKAATSIFGGGESAAGGAAQGAQLAASATALTTAGGTLTAAGGALTGAGTALATSGTTLVASAAPLTGAGFGLTGASLQLNASAIIWSATAAEITAAAALLLAANAAGGAAGGGFASGGYTGNGGINDVAGVVHGREFVVNAKATKQFLPMLRAINSGHMPGMRMGGLAGLPMPSASFGQRLSVGNDNGPRGGTTIHAPITIQGNATRQTALQLEGAVRRGVGRAAKVYG